MEITIAHVGKVAPQRGGIKKGQICTFMKAEEDDRAYAVLGDHSANWQALKGSVVSVNVLHDHDTFPLVELANGAGVSASNAPSPAPVAQSTPATPNVRPRPSLGVYRAFLEAQHEWAVRVTDGDHSVAEKYAIHLGMAYLQGQVVLDDTDEGAVPSGVPF